MVIPARIQQFELVSNGFVLSHAPHRLGPLQPTDPATPMDQLRELYAAHGYLWLKEILPRAAILDFRRRFFAAMQPTGMLATETDPVLGIAAAGAHDEVLARSLLMEAVRWSAYADLCQLPAIVQFYEAFWGGSVDLLQRKIIRYNLPQTAGATAGHYDLIYLRAGSDRVCSSWIPLGDITIEMGGLLYLEGSDAVGRAMEAEFSIKNAALSPAERISAYNKNMSEGGWISKDLAGLATKFDSRWLVADYAAGDMVVHSPYMIHGSTANRDPLGRIRLSTDIRFQPRDAMHDQRWNQDWFPEDNL